jgi:hypothetical protein
LSECGLARTAGSRFGASNDAIQIDAHLSAAVQTSADEMMRGYLLPSASHSIISETMHKFKTWVMQNDDGACSFIVWRFSWHYQRRRLFSLKQEEEDEEINCCD